MKDERNVPIEHAIEHAIETVRLFFDSHESKQIPSLERFDIQDGKLQQQTLSPLAKTIAFTKDCFLGSFSQEIRDKQLQKHKALTGTLQQSFDLLKVYTSAVADMRKGSVEDKELAERVLTAAKKYNDFVRLAKAPPNTLAGQIRQFFLRMAGWNMDDTLMQDEIHIPAHKVSTTAHKITLQNQNQAEKIFSVLQSIQRNADKSYPKQAEVDLFRTKALSLLLDNDSLPVSLEDALTHTLNSPITYTLHEGAFLLHESVISLRQLISTFPGVDMAITGSFQRSSFDHHLVVPIKESFELTSSIYQTGFPHPLQYTGLGLHEKLLPNSLLRPQMCPKFEQLLALKALLANELLPEGRLYPKANELLKRRRDLFRSSQELVRLQQGAFAALFAAAGVKNAPHISSYETISYATALFCTQAFAEPFNRLQQEWLIKHNPDIASKAASIMHGALEKAKSEIPEPYTHELVEALGKAGIAIHLMQLSEHLNFEPQELTSFEKKLLTLLFRQQLIFAYELQELKVENLESHLVQVLEEDTALFEGRHLRGIHTLKAQELVEELIQYYCVRFETLHTQR